MLKLKKFRFSRNNFHILIITLIMGLMLALGFVIEAERDHINKLSYELSHKSQKILHLDEILTMSARMAALTGDEMWEQRYDQFGQDLDALLARLEMIMPNAEGRRAVQNIIAINQSLVLVEKKAFEHVKKNQRERAQKLLFSPTYLQLSAEYAKAQKNIETAERAFFKRAEYTHDYVYLPCFILIGLSGLAMIAYSTYTSVVDRERRYNQEKTALEYRRLAALGDLSTGIAHEINNALQPILGLSEILMRRMTKDPSMDAAYGGYAKTIFESALYARRVVENVLDASQGRHTQLEQWDFYQVIRDALDLTRPAIPPEITMTEDLSATPSGSLTVVVNKTDVMRAVSNVIKNAVQAMQDGSSDLTRADINMTLHITSRRVVMARRMANVYDINPGEYVELSIRDTGPGMDAKTQSRIFEPFFSTKAHSGNEAQHAKGTGLGLAMVYAIMKQSDGTVIVKSAPGEGATFRLLFPLVQGKAHAKSQSKEQAA